MGTASWSWAVMRAAADLRARLAGTGGVGLVEGITDSADTTAQLATLPAQERQAHGAQFVEVAVDPLTGEVRVRRMLGIFAAGRIVNPLTARSQLVGGMVMGLSMALHEEGLRDSTFGGLANGDFAGYHIATHADVPEVEADWVDDREPSHPSGVKGLGEVSTVGTAAAIANAVWHAAGARHRDLPITPGRVLSHRG